MKTNHKRILALDVMRGITIAGMILVNNPGSWAYVYAPLKHAEWNGLTPTDLVFPFFMFIMGISTYLSLKKFEFKPSVKSFVKIVRRTVVIFLAGLALAWLSLTFRRWHELGDGDVLTRLLGAMNNFERVRILGVLQRLALSYGAAATLALWIRHRYIPYLIAGLLILYTCLLFQGAGFEYNETNILSIVDRSVLGITHVYKDNGIEPEGILSTLPSVAHVLLGFCCGRLLMRRKLDMEQRLLRLLLVGAVLTFAGFLLNYGCPINKKVWSPTFVLTTCGLGASFLAIMIWLTDVRMVKRTGFFEAFGVNPLFMYIVAAVLSILMGNVNVFYEGKVKSLHGFVYGDVLQPLLGDFPASLAFALMFVVIVWAVGYPLYRLKIYVKI
ncbi:MAG: heparan-alpha-glucosaminide N-acetyltransferase domain-containing protein [Tannerellaceae bacterium]|jgi:predicted acyltransferase|nr:heparan-alpha-glucosaminide N-acetyltransferase domain-containing protein [Tannerellaceae bacterium]